MNKNKKKREGGMCSKKKKKIKDGNKTRTLDGDWIAQISTLSSRSFFLPTSKREHFQWVRGLRWIP